MRSTLYILIILLSSTDLVAQYGAFQIAKGDSRELGLAITAMGWIESNEPEKVISKLLTTGSSDSLIIQGCTHVVSSYPPRPGLHATFLNEKDTTFSFERTYYKQTEEDTAFIYQIYIEQIKVEGEWWLSKVVFRDASTLEPRTAELKDLKDDSTPPPPPPPPGLD